MLPAVGSGSPVDAGAALVGVVGLAQRVDGPHEVVEVAPLDRVEGPGLPGLHQGVGVVGHEDHPGAGLGQLGYDLEAGHALQLVADHDHGGAQGVTQRDRLDRRGGLGDQLETPLDDDPPQRPAGQLIAVTNQHRYRHGDSLTHRRAGRRRFLWVVRPTAVVRSAHARRAARSRPS